MPYHELIANKVTLIHLETLATRLFSLKVFLPYFDGILIDSGFIHAWPQVWKFIQNKELHTIIHTHGHEDHVGNDINLQNQFQNKLKIFAPQKSISIIKNPQAIMFYRRFTWGLPTPSNASPLPNELAISNYDFHIIPCPGHSEDLVGIWEPNQSWFFGGDLFLGTYVKTASSWENGHDQIESLKRVIALQPKIYFCYHQGAIENPIRTLQTKLDFLQKTRDQVLALHAKGLSTIEIRKQVLGEEPWRLRLLTMPEMSRENLVRAFLKPPAIY